MRIYSKALAAFCGAWLIAGGASGALAGPAEAGEAEAATPDASPSDEGTASTAVSRTATVSAASVRRDMERNMSEIGELASEAKRDSDLVRATCVLDKQERAQGVMELATGEMLIIRDDGSSAESRSFAVEKLVAASQRLEDLVEQAHECTGDKTPEQSDDETRNTLDEEPSIPIADPTVGGAAGGGKPPPVPPPADNGQPPSVGSPSL